LGAFVPPDHLENIYIFYLPLSKYAAKKLLLGRKKFGEILAPLPICTPSYTYAEPSRKCDCYEEFSSSITMEKFHEM